MGLIPSIALPSTEVITSATAVRIGMIGWSMDVIKVEKISISGVIAVIMRLRIGVTSEIIRFKIGCKSDTIMVRIGVSIFRI